ncbi:hypothetical protein [Microbacterium sp. YY-01]|uniref:hypothetical protein n=1 Tax=Microbacterium sp. YY-01 TaxID=3421634 RepID=UPI003D168AB2
MSDLPRTTPPQEPNKVPTIVAVVLMIGTFFSVAIMGLGFLTLLTETDIIEVQGLGQAPGIIGMVAAILALTFLMLPTLRAARATFGAAMLATIVVPLAHLVVVWIVATVTGESIVDATVAARDLVLRGPSLILGLSALLVAGAAVMVRARGQQMRWPWEKHPES